MRAGILVALAVAVWIRCGNLVARTFEDDAPSQSFGTPADGRLENGKRLPDRGRNFRAYSRLGTALGRNTVHGDVRDVVLAAYAELERTQPGVKFVYGETGRPGGGPMPPHRTHRNGQSVDFMVPVRDAGGFSVRLPTPPWQRFGYDHQFDAQGRAGDLRIDNDAIVAHLSALAEAAPRHGLRIQRVIYAPDLQPALFAARGGTALRARVPFMATPSWVRHDEHYHVDFARLPRGAAGRP
jgi:penicillin-insensitive murein endopeptidase